LFCKGRLFVFRIIDERRKKGQEKTKFFHSLRRRKPTTTIGMG